MERDEPQRLLPSPPQRDHRDEHRHASGVGFAGGLSHERHRARSGAEESRRRDQPQEYVQVQR
jgi:hypothetical protein